MPLVMKTVWICAIVCAGVCAAQEPKDSDTTKGMGEKRMELMRRRVEELSAVGLDKQKYEFSKEPMLRYSDAARDILDAGLWGLGRTGRPHAVLVLEIYGGPYVQYELTAVAEPPRAVRSPRFTWSPRATPFTWTKVPDLDPPHATQNVRRRQIKQAAQKFSASEQWRGQSHQLRLMPQPIHQYEDKEQGILDGAIFVWAHGTNVEILMFLEARQEEQGANQWVAGFSRLAAASLDVDFNERDFWNSPQNVTGGQASPYFFHSEPLTADERTAFATE